MIIIIIIVSLEETITGLKNIFKKRPLPSMK